MGCFFQLGKGSLWVCDVLSILKAENYPGQNKNWIKCCSIFFNSIAAPTLPLKYEVTYRAFLFHYETQYDDPVFIEKIF